MPCKAENWHVKSHELFFSAYRFLEISVPESLLDRLKYDYSCGSTGAKDFFVISSCIKHTVKHPWYTYDTSTYKISTKKYILM